MRLELIITGQKDQGDRIKVKAVWLLIEKLRSVAELQVFFDKAVVSNYDMRKGYALLSVHLNHILARSDSLIDVPAACLYSEYLR